MTAANELASKKQYQLALEKYTQASFMKTEEKLPKDKMAEMHRLMQAEIDAATSAELEAKFQKAMADAQKLADGNALAEAIAGFQSALAIKPNESLPVQRIAELQKRLDESSRPKTEAEVAEPLAQSAPDTTGSYLKRLDAEYQTHIQNGDNYFTAKNYSQAKTEYLAATALKHLERYPQSRIKLIDELTKPAAEKQQDSAVAEAKPKSAPINNEYDRRIAEANELFDAANWKAAKQAYAAALTTNPYSTFAKSRANQCDYAMRQDEHNAKMKNAAQAAADMRAVRDQKRNEHAAAMQEAYARAEQDRAKRAEELNAMRASATTKKQQQNYQAKDPINRTSVGANAAREEQVEKEYRERREQEEKNKMNRINNQKAKYAGYSRNMERKADTRTKENLHHINDRKGEH
jgi:hypothetical protein